MAVEFETRKETNKLVKWKVGIPRASYRTDDFQVHGYNWYFRLNTMSYYNGTDEEWQMILYSRDKNNPSRFPLRVFIRYQSKDLYMSQAEISGGTTVIWQTLQSNFRRTYPDVQVTGTCLQFVFDFHLAIRDPETPIKVEKSVQTSYPNPENYPCLENLSLDLSKLLEGGTDTDVQLKCGDVSIGVHKMILGARSEVFRTMMQSDMVEGRVGIFQIIDMEPKILKTFIRYIYTGNLPEMTVDTALPIYEAADKYQVEALKKLSGQILVDNVSPENALVILAAADAHSDSDLKDQLVSYIIKERIPSRKVAWLKFCNEYPKLALEVFNLLYDLPSVSQ